MTGGDVSAFVLRAVSIAAWMAMPSCRMRACCVYQAILDLESAAQAAERRYYPTPWLTADGIDATKVPR